MAMMKNIVNGLLCYVGWIACVWGAASGRPYLGPWIVAGALGLHFVLQPRVKVELLTIFLVSVAGLAIDSGLLSLKVFSFPPATLGELWLPLWYAAIWPLFATTLRHSLASITARPLLAALFGLVGGPFSFYCADRLGAIVLADSLVFALGALAVAWVVYMVGFAYGLKLSPAPTGKTSVSSSL